MFQTAGRRSEVVGVRCIIAGLIITMGLTSATAGWNIIAGASIAGWSTIAGWRDIIAFTAEISANIGGRTGMSATSAGATRGQVAKWKCHPRCEPRAGIIGGAGTRPVW